MGIIREETTHEHLGASFEIVEREPGETREQWRFIDVELDSLELFTPKEMRELGHWLVRESKRIGREYKSNGAPRPVMKENADAS